MFKVQSTHSSDIYKTILVITAVVWSFVVLDIVNAGEQTYIYASDLGKKQKKLNSKQEIWQYQHEVPLAFQDNNYTDQNQYTYPPPTHKVGSNPISSPQYNNYQLSVSKDADKHNNMAGISYRYLQPVQKIGSNPFIKQHNRYVTPDKIEQFFASSCGCEKSAYQGVYANY